MKEKVLSETRYLAAKDISFSPTRMYQRGVSKMVSALMYLGRYNIWVEADVWLNSSSVSVVSGPHLDIP